MAGFEVSPEVGKSSLLNSFFSAIYQGSPPKDLARRVAKTPVDKRFTYITHPTFSNRFRRTDDIEIVSAEHDFFRRINFIDTPGTGWKTFTAREVTDLVSCADVMLFIFKPTDLLDSLTVETLNIKFSHFDQIPILYVVTHASDYTDHEDWTRVRYDEFAENLKNAHHELETEEGLGVEDRGIARLSVESSGSQITHFTTPFSA